MNSDIESIGSLLREVRGDLMGKENVVATGIGFKTTGGQSTPELSIICSVEIKKAASKLRKEDLIPPLLGKVPTDVKPSGIIRAFQSPTSRLRPAWGGCSVGHFQITAGTLGCLVKKNDTAYILSNNHVLANSNEGTKGDPILQPGPYDGGRLNVDKLALLNEFIPIQFMEEQVTNCSMARGITNLLNRLSSMLGSKVRIRPYRLMESENRVDCALATPFIPGDVKNEILQIGPITGIGKGDPGMKIKKSGRTTGLTMGSIEQIDVSAQVSYGTNKTALFTDQILAGAMSQGGDSGSVVLDENNKAIGLLFAGSDSTTIINRIDNVFNSLGVTLV